MPCSPARSLLPSNRSEFQRRCRSGFEIRATPQSPLAKFRIIQGDWEAMIGMIQTALKSPEPGTDNRSRLVLGCIRGVSCMGSQMGDTHTRRRDGRFPIGCRR